MLQRSDVSRTERPSEASPARALEWNLGRLLYVLSGNLRQRAGGGDQGTLSDDDEGNVSRAGHSSEDHAPALIRGV